MKQACSLALLQVSLTFKFSSITRDREMNFLPPGLRKIQTGKLICGPIGAVVKVPPGSRVHQRKLDLPGDVGTVNRPVATLHLTVNRADHGKRNPCDDENTTESPFVVHGTHSSPRLARNSENISVLYCNQLFQSQVLKSMLACLPDEFRIDSHHLGAGDLITAQVFESSGLQRFHVFSRDSLNFHSDDLIHIGIDSGDSQLLDVFGRYALNFHSHNFLSARLQS